MGHFELSQSKDFICKWSGATQPSFEANPAHPGWVGHNFEQGQGHPNQSQGLLGNNKYGFQVNFSSVKLFKNHTGMS